MAIPTHVGTSASVVGSAGTNTIPWPAGHQSGDIGILVAETAAEAVTETTSGWTEVSSSPQEDSGASTAARITVFWKRATGSSEANAELSDAGDHTNGAMTVIRGCVASGDPVNVTAGGHSGSSSTGLTIPGATTTVDDCLVVLLAAFGFSTGGGELSGSLTNTDLANITVRLDDGSVTGNGGGILIATGEKASAGAYGSTTGTITNSSRKGFISIALAPEAGGGGSDIEVTVTKGVIVFDFGSVTVTGAEDTAAASSDTRGYGYDIARRLRQARPWKPRSGRWN